jgi:hypothetical protein
MTSTQIAAWTPVIIKGSVFQKTFAFEDEVGNPVTFTSAQINVQPNGAAPFSWTQGNGKFTNTGPGTYLLDIGDTETSGYTWSSGHWELAVMEGADPYPCLIEGTIFVKEC